MWNIKLKPHQKLFFTSDTHYHHKNICRGVTGWRTEDGGIPIDQTRDFKDLGQMNATIVNNINAVVGQDDILVHLGDWSFGGFEYISEFRNRLVCQNVYLILGNHDHHIERNKQDIQDLFIKTSHYEILYVTDENGDDLKYDFVLSHFPICSWHDMSRGRFHLFGHVHLPGHKKIMPGRSMDVGCDGNNLKPYELKEVISLLETRPIKAGALPSDHHEERLQGAQ
jgi:calcineurin-like phosphoesterase family protein